MRVLIHSIIIIFIVNILGISAVLFLGQYIAGSVIAYTASDALQNPTVMLIDTRTALTLDLIQHIGDGKVTGRTPIWSPSGDYVAFWTFHNRNDTFAYELDWDTYQFQNLTTTYNYFSLPLYGANNQRLFATFPSYNSVSVFLFNEDYPDGEQIIASTLGMPTWSPDGRYIAFLTSLDELQTTDTSLSSGVEGQDIDLYVIDTATQDIRNYTSTLDAVGTPIWSPDGSQIAFVSSQRNFHLIDIETGDINDIQTDVRVIDRPTWSPDGRYLAFTSNQRGDGNEINVEVMILDMETFEVQTISNSPFYDIEPTWSPDGQFLAFVSQRENDQDEIYIANIENGKIRRLTFTDVDESDIAWRPR